MRQHTPGRSRTGDQRLQKSTPQGVSDDTNATSGSIPPAPETRNAPEANAKGATKVQPDSTHSGPTTRRPLPLEIK